MSADQNEEEVQECGLCGGRVERGNRNDHCLSYHGYRFCSEGCKRGFLDDVFADIPTDFVACARSGRRMLGGAALVAFLLLVAHLVRVLRS